MSIPSFGRNDMCRITYEFHGYLSIKVTKAVEFLKERYVLDLGYI